MTIAGVISILLFILPGILAEKISHKIDFPTGKKRNDFMETVNGIALSFPILIVVVLYVQQKYCFSTIAQFVQKIDNLDFLFEVCLYASIVSILTGLLYLPIKSAIRWIVNLLREKLLNKMKTDDKSCWRKFLIDDNTYKYLEVIKDGVSYKGFLGPFSLPDESREITLCTSEKLLYNPDYNPEILFTKIKATYIDVEKNIVVHDYDTIEYEKWYNKKKNENFE